MFGLGVIFLIEILVILVVAFLPISRFSKIALDCIAALILALYFNPISAPTPKLEDSISDTKPEIIVSKNPKSLSKPNLVIPDDYPHSYLITYALNEILRKHELSDTMSNKLSYVNEFPSKVTPYNY